MPRIHALCIALPATRLDDYDTQLTATVHVYARVCACVQVDHYDESAAVLLRAA
jgi:hypothetical protein